MPSFDPAGNPKKAALKRVRARSAVVVVGADYLERIFVLYSWADRAATPTLLEQIFEVNERFHPRRFGCEANAMQSLFAEAVRYVAKDKGKSLPLVAVQQPTKITKEFRIRSILQPVVGNGRLFLQPNQHELRAEITAFPTGMTVDLVDALASCVSLIPKVTRRELDNRAETNIRQYLIDSGLNEQEILLTLADLERENAGSPVGTRWN